MHKGVNIAEHMPQLCPVLLKQYTLSLLFSVTLVVAVVYVGSLLITDY
jgi:hypothetical protein